MSWRFRQPTTTGPLVALSLGPYELVVAPRFGGRIVRFGHAGRDILRPTPAAVLAQPRVYEFAGFPLMPYSGPLFGPGFSFAGTEHALGRTVREEPTATHGDAWIAPFEILAETSTELTLHIGHEPGAGTFPFSWKGLLGFSLSRAGLAIRIRVTSSDHRPMPAGIGFHPYFPRHDGTRLRFNSIGVWPADAPQAVTTGCGPMIEGLDFSVGPDVSSMVVDRLYEGWDGRAELIAADGARTVIEADGALDKLQVYSPWGYPYVCVEPVSNANDGFNRMAAGVPSHGVRVLEPGRSIDGEIRIFAA